jgi:serine/threonine protein kinase/Flp pilus assembly protein TadD
MATGEWATPAVLADADDDRMFAQSDNNEKGYMQPASLIDCWHRKMTIAEGTQFGPHKVLEKIGSGGMGEVYRAMDTRLEREVALKLVSESFLGVESEGSPLPGGATPHSRAHLTHERFLREARSAATLSHPNICAIYDTGEQDGRPYLVMELLHGETLKQYLANAGKPLRPDEVIAFSKQAASALAAAHSKGIVHRDIKPANLFVNQLGRDRRQIKILDFGLAKKQGGAASGDSRPFTADATATGEASVLDLTSPGSTIGTVAYMSPEQAKGLPLDARTDLFSLGTVIYEMATNRKPFAGDSTAEVFVALLREDPPPVSTVNPAMPKALDEIVTSLLAKEREHRYQSAEDLLQDLESLEIGEAKEERAARGSSSQMAAASSGIISAATAVAEPPARPASRKWLAAVGGVVLLLIAGGLAWWKLAPKATPAPSAAVPAVSTTTPKLVKDSIILADFVNKTHDPVFDTTLNQALQIDLEQSPVINIVSQEHLRQSVKYLGKPDGTPITPEIAREIGEREGMKAILTGTIANLGKEYVITLAAQNTATGDEIASEQATASDKEQVLGALGTAAAAMRAKLGEDLASIKKLDTPFGQATTPSLEAFRAYALGDEAHQRGQNIPEAEGHYLRALELDPNFAMACARLGVIYLNSGQYAKANQFFARAFDLSKRVSERERFYITGHYYENVIGNLSKVVETLQEAVLTYPGQLDNYVNLNAAYAYLGQFEKALPLGQKAVEMQPEDAISSQNLISNYVALGRMTEAREEMERAHRLGMDASPGVAMTHLYGYFLMGDPQQVQRIVTQAAGLPDEFLVTEALALTQQFSGKYRQAASTFAQAFEQAGRGKASDVQAGVLLMNAAGRGLAGLCDGNQAAVEQAMALDKSKQTQEYALLAAAVCGNGELALPIARELGAKFPEDTLLQNVYVPLTQAFLALAAGQSQEVLGYAARAKSYDAIYPGSYTQGMAYLQLRDGGHAVSAFQSALQSRGGSLVGSQEPMPSSYAQAQLGLARAYAMAGDKANAKKAYEAFFLTWKDADPDLPMLVAGRKEYASL